MATAPAAAMARCQRATLAVIALRALAIVVAVGVLLPTLAAVAHGLRAAVVVAAARLPMLVTLAWWPGLGATVPSIETDRLPTTLGGSQAGRTRAPALGTGAGLGGHHLQCRAAAGEANTLVAGYQTARVVRTGQRLAGPRRRR